MSNYFYCGELFLDAGVSEDGTTSSTAAIAASLTWSKVLAVLSAGELTNYEDAAEATKMLQYHLFPRFNNNFLAIADELADARSKVCGKVLTWLAESSERYIPLIKLYEDNAAKLMDDIKTTATSRFNDTPQNGGDWSDDKHTTNINTAESTTSAATPMARLKEIKDNIDSLYEEWAISFRKFIVVR